MSAAGALTDPQPTLSTVDTKYQDFLLRIIILNLTVIRQKTFKMQYNTISFMKKKIL